MANLVPVVLPPGWRLPVGVQYVFDQTRTGRLGNWDIQENGPYRVLQLTLNYLRDQQIDNLDAVRNFYQNYRADAFLVDYTADDTDDALGGSGVVEMVNGVLRMMKHYPGQNSDYYAHPITRPKSGTITLAGGASGGTIDYDTGIVTGMGITAGTWTGNFYVPMIFRANSFVSEVGTNFLASSMQMQFEEFLEI